MKNARHTKILELIHQYSIDRQEELLRYLKESGFDVTQATVSRDIRELRLISGTSVDKRYSLPDTCIGATVRDKNLYAVSGTTLYRAAVDDMRFTEYELPLAQEATRFVGALKNGYVILVCGSDVYVCSLPQAGG